MNCGARMDIECFCCTPIYAAADKGHVEIVRELVNRGAGMDISNDDVRTTIYAAAKGGHVEVVRELLNCGARVDSTAQLISVAHLSMQQPKQDTWRLSESC